MVSTGLYSPAMNSKAFARHAVSAASWVKRNPTEVVTAIRNALGLKLTVPLDALRALAGGMSGRRAPRDVEILSMPPGLRVSATLDVMKTELRAGATVRIDAVNLSPVEMRFAVRIHDIEINVLGSPDSPIASLISSGSLDLSKPGKLLKHLPKKPPIVIDADDDFIVLDLLRDPKIAKKARKVVSMVTPVVTVRGVEANGDHLAIQLACLPDGLTTAVESIRAAV